MPLQIQDFDWPLRWPRRDVNVINTQGKEYKTREMRHVKISLFIFIYFTFLSLSYRREMILSKYTKILNNQIKKLNLSKIEQKQTILCLYVIHGCSIEDCSKLFNIKTNNIIAYIKSEKLYNYQACSKCGKLKNRITDFRKYKNRKILICIKCEKEYNQKQKKTYYQNNKTYLKKYSNQVYQNNKIDKKEKFKNYYQNNKERFIQYNKDNKEKISIYNKQRQQTKASIKLVQKLSGIEPIKDNQIKCKYCGKWITPTILQVNNRVKGLKNTDTGYIYCSEECKKSCPTYGQKKYPKGFKNITSREVNPELRQIVFKRDNHTCQKCGKYKNISLHCHHIIPHVNSPIESNDPDNCITLCKDCHKLVHTLPDCRYHELKCGK